MFPSTSKSYFFKLFLKHFNKCGVSNITKYLFSSRQKYGLSGVTFSRFKNKLWLLCPMSETITRTRKPIDSKRVKHSFRISSKFAAFMALREKKNANGCFQFPNEPRIINTNAWFAGYLENPLVPWFENPLTWSRDWSYDSPERNDISSKHSTHWRSSSVKADTFLFRVSSTSVENPASLSIPCNGRMSKLMLGRRKIFLKCLYAVVLWKYMHMHRIFISQLHLLLLLCCWHLSAFFSTSTKKLQLGPSKIPDTCLMASDRDSSGNSRVSSSAPSSFRRRRVFLTRNLLTSARSFLLFGVRTGHVSCFEELSASGDEGRSSGGGGSAGIAEAAVVFTPDSFSTAKTS